eukprot:3936153-Prorocentrum_lima.AAC.1
MDGPPPRDSVTCAKDPELILQDEVAAKAACTFPGSARLDMPISRLSMVGMLLRASCVTTLGQRERSLGVRDRIDGHGLRG